MWAFVLITFILLYAWSKTKSVYLVDFQTFEPPVEWQTSHKQIGHMLRNIASDRKRKGYRHFNSELDVQFQQRILENSGTGDATAFPPAFLKFKTTDRDHGTTFTMQETIDEAETILFQCMDALLSRTRLHPKKIDCVVLNCSLFSPTPSLCAMVCKKYGLKPHVKTYNLSGQGCSASIVAVDLARDFLNSNPHSIAIVLSTELISQSLYHGHEKSMLIQNTLFRSGGAAVMLTNKWYHIMSSKYMLHSLVRTQVSDQDSYQSVIEQEDEYGNHGVALSKQVTAVAAKAITINLKTLAPSVLPLWEKIRVAMSVEKKAGGKRVYSYTPPIKSAVEWLCIHPGGRAVLDTLQSSLKLSDDDMQASRSVLRKYGNTSSSSIWYELQYHEANSKMKEGDKVLQLAFGSGFKCNSAVWKKL